MPIVKQINDQRSGTLYDIRDANAQEQLATIPSTTERGMVMVDGRTIIADENGVISATGTPGPGPSPEPAPTSNNFIMKFTITAADIANETNTIYLPFIAQRAAMDVEVDWGDNSEHSVWNRDEAIAPYPGHTYEVAGDYYVTIINNSNPINHPEVAQCMPIFPNGEQIPNYENPKDVNAEGIYGNESELAGYGQVFNGDFYTAYEVFTGNPSAFQLNDRINIYLGESIHYFGIHDDNTEKRKCYMVLKMQDFISTNDSSKYPFVNIGIDVKNGMNPKIINTYMAEGTGDEYSPATITKILKSYTVEAAPSRNNYISIDLSQFTLNNGVQKYLIIESLDSTTVFYEPSTHFISACKYKYVKNVPESPSESYRQVHYPQFSPSVGDIIQAPANENYGEYNKIEIPHDVDENDNIIYYSNFIINENYFYNGCNNYILDTSNLLNGTLTAYKCIYDSNNDEFYINSIINLSGNQSNPSLDLTNINSINLSPDYFIENNTPCWVLINITNIDEHSWKDIYNVGTNLTLNPVNYVQSPSLKWNISPYATWRNTLIKVVSPLLKMADIRYNEETYQDEVTFQTDINKLFSECKKLTGTVSNNVVTPPIPSNLFSIIGSTLIDNDEYGNYYGAMAFMFYNSGLTYYPKYLLRASYFTDKIHTLWGFFENSNVSSISTPLFEYGDSLFSNFSEMFKGCPLQQLDYIIYDNENEGISNTEYIFDVFEYPLLMINSYKKWSEPIYFNETFANTPITTTKGSNNAQGGIFYHPTSYGYYIYDASLGIDGASFNFYETFMNCPNLKISSNDFYTNTQIYENVDNFIQSFDFTYHRDYATQYANAGTAPEFWNMYSSGATTSNGCFSGNGNDSTTLSNYDYISGNWM